MNNAFLRSYHVLGAVYKDRAFSVIELNKQLTFAEKREKALITKIVYGVLDRDIELDYILRSFVKKAKPDVRILLKIGTYCLKYLSLPEYAVINDLAELSKIFGDRYIVGFVNATLKNVAKAVKTDMEYPADDTESLSVRYSYPLWALKKLIKDYGRAEAEKIVSAKLPESTDIRVNTDKISPQRFEEMLRETGVVYRRTPLADAFSVSGAVGGIPEELYTAQSLPSMFVAHIVGGRGAVLDACAAPGGKAVYIKQLGARSVTACDIHEHRVALIKKYADRMCADVDAVCCDSTVYRPEWHERFDAVLCDVPCSGFGVTDSRPDIKLFRESKDISDLMKVQYAILQNCSRYLKKGGVLVYSTCTVFHNENGQIVEKFLQNHEEFVPAEIRLPFDCRANGRAMYQFLPHIDGVPGFFCAKMIKK